MHENSACLYFAYMKTFLFKYLSLLKCATLSLPVQQTFYIQKVSLKVELQICNKSNFVASQAVAEYQNTWNFHGKSVKQNMVNRGNAE